MDTTRGSSGDRIPTNLSRVARRLFSSAEDQQRFAESLTFPTELASAVVWLGPNQGLFPEIERVSFQPDWISRIVPGTRTGSSEPYRDGDLYSLDISSVFAAIPLLERTGELRESLIIDTCASPGGKSILCYRGLSPRLLIANETIKGRVKALISNFSRCHLKNCAVVSYEIERLQQVLGAAFGIVIVDAPCTGQSLLAKGEKNPGCFHPVNINKNSNRQKKIIANSAKLVAPGGYLLYSTCTFSYQENEQVVEWLLANEPDFTAIESASLSEYRTGLSDTPCYRLFPHSGIGAGAFTALLRRNQGGITREPDLTTLKFYWRSDR